MATSVEKRAATYICRNAPLTPRNLKAQQLAQLDEDAKQRGQTEVALALIELAYRACDSELDHTEN